MTDKYDYVGEFHQGVAIVVKNRLYGAILMGGNEIIAPCYDYISPFKDGYAQAIRKGECKIIDLSGREGKQYEGKFITIPSKYDYVRDFKNGYACVQLNGKWGAIDVNCNEIYEPQFYFLSDFVGGTAKYKKTEYDPWGFLNTDGFCSECNLTEPEIEPDGNLIIERDELFIDSNGLHILKARRRVRINNKGQLLVKNENTVIALPKKFIIARDYKDGMSLVQDSTGFWGAVNTKGQIIVPLEYSKINDFSEDKTFAKNRNGKLCLISATGSIIKEFDKFTDGEFFNHGYAIVSENDKHGLVNNNGEEILSPINAYISYTQTPHEFEITSSYIEGKRGIFVASTRLLIKPRFKKIIEVKKDCVKVEVDDIGECLIDLSGCVFVEKDGKRITFPDWCIGVKHLSDNIFLGITDNGEWGLLNGSGETLCMPTFDKIGEVDNDIIPLIKKETITVGGWRKETKEIMKYGLYNVNSKVFIPVEYDVCPEYSDGYYKITLKGSLGIINGEGEIVLKPEWKQILSTNGYYVVSKIIKENYSKNEKYGLAKSNGDLILETKYEAISVLRDGIYKVKENNSWSIFNNEGRITTETYDEIYLDGNIFVVSKNGLNGKLNKNAEKVIKTDDGKYIELPSKFDWGYDFENGTAKVFINGCENHVDKSFHIVIINENKIIPIAKSIDYLVTQDEYRYYIFISDKKYGLLNNTGECMIEAKYQYLSHLANELYIAGIARSRSSNGIESPILKYGLINSNGILCIPTEYDDIQMIENRFLVKKNNKYGIIDYNYAIVCEPKYSTIKYIDNGLWKVSITDNNRNELYGILDSYGKERLETIYQFIGDINDDSIAKGRAIIKSQELLGLVDENYCILATPQYDHISAYKNGKATVIGHTQKSNKVCGEIDINGNFTDISEIAKTEVHSISSADATNSNLKKLKNGYIVIQKDYPSPIHKYCAIIDENNNIILPYKYNDIIELENGMFLVYLAGLFGLLDQEFKEVVTPIYDKISLIQDVFVVKKWPGNGLINSNGEIILPSEYSSIISAAPGLVWISQGELVGLATIKGKILLNPTYGKINPFKNGYATVNNGHWYDDDDDDDHGYLPSRTRKFSMGKWGVINTNGQLIIPTIYDSINIEEDSCFSVSKNRLTGRLNKDGELIIKNKHGEYILASKKYDWQDDYNTNGQSTVYYKGNVGIVDENCQFMILSKDKEATIFTLPKEYDWAYESIHEFVIVEKDHKKGVIDFNNNIIIKPDYDQINILNDSTNFVFKCGIQNEDSDSPETWSIINVNGNPIIDLQSEEIIHLGFSILAIKTNNYKYSIVNFNGKLTSKTLFDAVLCFGVSSSDSTKHSWKTPKKLDGLNYAIVELDGKYGIIDNQGRLVIHPKYTSLLIQNNGQFLADGKLINAFEQKIVVKNNSVLIISEDYDKIKLLENGLLLVSKNELFGCINQIGTIIIPLKYKSLTYQNNLLIAVCYDDTDETYKCGVLDFQGNQIVPFHQQIIKIESSIILYEQNGQWGAYTLQGQVVCEPLYDYIVHVADNLIKVGIDDGGDICYDDDDYYYWKDKDCYDFTNYRNSAIINWGLIDNNGNEVLPHEYSAIADKIINGLVEIRSNKRIGYIDITGRILLEPTYKSIGEFVDGYAVVSVSYFNEEGYKIVRYGVIDSQFKEIIPCVFGSIEYEQKTNRFKTEVGYKTIDGRYVAEVDGEEILIDKKYKYCETFDKTCAIAVLITKNDKQVKYGLIDKKSNDILPPIFSRLDYIGKGVYKFKINDLYGLGNSNGDIILPNIYNGIGNFEDDLACVQINVLSNYRNEQKKLYGFIDSLGNEILPPSYEIICKRSNNFAVVMKNNRWGVFNFENHQIKIIPNATYLGPCIDNLCKINIGGIYDKRLKKVTDGKWGYVSVDGQTIIEPIYDQACNFSNGMAAVKYNDKWGFINTKGIIIVPCEYDEIESNYIDGEGKLVKDSEVFVFDKSGRLIESYEQENDDDYYYDDYNDNTPTYSKYGGYNGYSDQAIDEAFDGDPSLTWNCD